MTRLFDAICGDRRGAALVLLALLGMIVAVVGFLNIRPTGAFDLSDWAWFGVGCGGFALYGFAVIRMAGGRV